MAATCWPWWPWFPALYRRALLSTNLTGQNVFAAGNYQIGGGNSNQGSVLVDGVSVNTSYGNAVELVMDQDSVQEFNVQTHNNTAEFGAYTGGVINMSTKSGTNTFHGDAYEYVRNTLLNANNFFANRNKSGRQAWHQNQFGANGGGPILKNKVFFFGAYQGYRQTNGQPVTVTVPTAAELTGDFSANSAHHLRSAHDLRLPRQPGLYSTASSGNSTFPDAIPTEQHRPRGQDEHGCQESDQVPALRETECCGQRN